MPLAARAEHLSSDRLSLVVLGKVLVLMSSRHPVEEKMVS
jgi:hypothetical protein